jgi:hypothetical protein
LILVGGNLDVATAPLRRTYGREATEGAGVTRNGWIRSVVCAGLVVSGLSSLPARGATAPAGRTTLLSASIVTGKPSATGSVVSVTATSNDGRYVVFDSSATDLVLGDTNALSDIFEYDRIARVLTRVSVSSEGLQGIGVTGDPHDPNNPVPAGSEFPAISASGRFVAFYSDDVNLVVGDTNAANDVFVHDLVTKKTERVSVATGGAQANAASGGSVTMSGDGRYVAFVSAATNLVANDSNGLTDVFVHDRKTNVTKKVSGAAGVNAGYIAMSQDGRYVAYPAGSPRQIIVHDMKTGAEKRGDLLDGGKAPTSTPGASGAWLVRGALSANGRYLLFSSSDAYVPARRSMSTVPGFPGGEFYRHDFVTGHTLRLTVTSAGEERDGGTSLADGALSPDGRFAVFSTQQQFDAITNTTCVLCAGLTAYVHDCDTYTTTAQSVTLDDTVTRDLPTVGGATPTRPVAHYPSISAGGRYVALAANSYPLPGTVPTNGNLNAFLRDRGLVRGVGEISVANAAGFAQTGILARSDSLADVSDLETARGANLDEAALISRPTEGDLLVRLGVVQMPAFGLADPTLLYAMDLRAGRTTYEVRAQKVGLTARFGLFRQTAYGWTHVADLHGGYGTTGDEVVAAVPSSLFGGAQQHITLSDTKAMTGVGSFDTGIVSIIDSVSLQSV